MALQISSKEGYDLTLLINLVHDYEDSMVMCKFASIWHLNIQD
jgi:hypothetical protein